MRLLDWGRAWVARATCDSQTARVHTPPHTCMCKHTVHKQAHLSLRHVHTHHAHAHTHTHTVLLQVVTAFVTFSTAESRYRAMEALPRSLMRQWRMPPADKFDNGGRGRCGPWDTGVAARVLALVLSGRMR